MKLFAPNDPITERVGRIWGLCVIVAATSYACWVWVPTALTAAYVLDDAIVLLQNPAVAWPPDLARIFTAPWFPAEAGFAHVVLSRPLATLSYCLEIPLGIATPFGRHAVQLGLYALCCVLLGLVGARLLRAKPWDRPHFVGLSAILFALLPVHTEVVMCVANRPELLAMIAVLATTLPLVEIRAGSGNWRHSAGAAAAFTAALFCKESSLAVLGAWFLWASCTRAGWQRLWRTLALLVAIAAVWWLWRRSVFGSVIGQPIPYLDNPIAGLPALARIGHALRLVWTAVQHLLLPFFLLDASALAPDYVFHAQVFPHPPAGDEFGVPGAMGLATVLALAYAVGRTWWSARRWPDEETELHETGLFALGLLACAYLPVSNLLFPSTTLFADRLLFLPSAGFVLIVVMFAGCLESHRPRPMLLHLQMATSAGVGVVSCFFGSIIAAEYAAAWSNDAALQQFPPDQAGHYGVYPHGSPRMRHNQAFRLLQEGEFNTALWHWSEATRQYGRDPELLTLGIDIRRAWAKAQDRREFKDVCEYELAEDCTYFYWHPTCLLAQTFPPPAKASLSAVDLAFTCGKFARVWEIVRYVPAQKVPHPWPRRFLALAAAAGELESGVQWAKHFSPDPRHDPAWASAAVFGLVEGGHSLQAAQVLADLHRARPQVQGLDAAARDLWQKHRTGPAAEPLRATLATAFPDLDLPPPDAITPSAAASPTAP